LVDRDASIAFANFSLSSLLALVGKKSTANKTSGTQTLHSSVHRWTSTTSKSTRFWDVDEGDAPAMPQRMACRIDRPCARMTALPCSDSVSTVIVRLIKRTINVQAATREYRSCSVNARTVHWIKASRAAGGSRKRRGAKCCTTISIQLKKSWTMSGLFSIAPFSPKNLNDTSRMIGSAVNTVAFASSVGTASKLVKDGGSS